MQIETTIYLDRCFEVGQTLSFENKEGDWLSIGADTPKDLIGTAYFAYSTHLLSRAYRAVDLISTADGTVTKLNPSPNNRNYYGHTMALSPF